MSGFVNIKSLLSLEELINDYRVECYTYIDRRCNEIVVSEEMSNEDEDFIMLPTLDELYPYGEAVWDYECSREIDIPQNVKPGKYFRENGYLEDFYEYRLKQAVFRMKKWLLDRGYRVVNNEEAEACASVYESYRFEKFVVGECNNRAYHKALHFAQRIITHPVLLIKGPSGMGKAHLLKAILDYRYKENPQFNALLISGEGSAEGKHFCKLQYLQDYMDVDMLVIDNIQYILDSPENVDGFLNLLRFRMECNKDTVLSCDISKEDVEGLEYKLGEDASKVCVARVRHADTETKRKILDATIEEAKAWSLFDELTIENILKGSENIRVLLGMAIKVIAEDKIGDIEWDVINILGNSTGYAIMETDEHGNESMFVKKFSKDCAYTC